MQHLMRGINKMMKLMTMCSLILATNTANAEDILGYLTDKDGKYTGPTVEQNVESMDTDKNGFADVLEVRAFLALKHGKDYEKALLDRWEVHSLGGGCPVPFAKEFVSESKN
jgi:hypothetical protein